MSSIVKRALWRQPTKHIFSIIRFESSTTAKATEASKNSASKAQEIASGMKSKTSQGLSRVTSAAAPALSGATESVGNALGRIGGRTGRLIAFVKRQIPPTVYYAKVGLELARMTFHGRKMSPPHLTTFQSYVERLLQNARNPGALFAQASNAAPANPSSIINQVRSLSREQWVAGGVVAAEVLGFFTVGEIIGKFKLIGYWGETEAHH